MLVDGEHYRTVWNDKGVMKLIDQTFLPHEFKVIDIPTVKDVIYAIKEFQVRGAGCIGCTAAHGMYVAAKEADKDDFDNSLKDLAELIADARPTATNLRWAVDRQLRAINSVSGIEHKMAIALRTAEEITDEDADFCRRIGEHGYKIIENIYNIDKTPVNILTHCNAGWLAFADYGSATAPIYAAHDKGIPVNVYVDETRPNSQGARLTAWELLKHGVPHKVITDNAGGLQAMLGNIDMMIVGTDRTLARTGDVFNKIGTYLKALAAEDNEIPFYVALPSSTFDWEETNWLNILIEERNPDEVRYATGKTRDGKIVDVLIPPEESPVSNLVFDRTPARLITNFITERGIMKPTEVMKHYPEYQ